MITKREIESVRDHAATFDREVRLSINAGTLVDLCDLAEQHFAVQSVRECVYVTRQWTWKTQCGYTMSSFIQPTFCPHCGGKVVVKQEDAR